MDEIITKHPVHVQLRKAELVIAYWKMECACRDKAIADLEKEVARLRAGVSRIIVQTDEIIAGLRS